MPGLHRDFRLQAAGARYLDGGYKVRLKGCQAAHKRIACCWRNRRPGTPKGHCVSEDQNSVRWRNIDLA
jgi:hypothetical protein